MQEPFHVLIVEDHRPDAELMREAWKQCSAVTATTFILLDCRETMRFLRRAAPFEEMPAIDLILLDYRMPLNGGLALAEIKGDPDYRHLPVIVFSGSSDNRDYLDAYRRGANCCFRKPPDLDSHLKLACDIAEHWLLKAVLPRC